MPSQQKIRKICVVTGTRAEYGLLQPLLRMMRDDPQIQLQLVVTGAHLSAEFGLTYKVIEADGFKITEKVEMLLSSDTPSGVIKSIGLGTIGFSDTLERLAPDWLVLCGDRYEMMAPAQAALISRIPIAHLFGGDDTPNAFDNTVRNCLTKMSHLHFTMIDEASKRVRQMGEDPRMIHTVGHTGIDHIRKMVFSSKSEFEAEIQLKLRKKNVLVTFHPTSLDFQPVEEQIEILLQALESFGPDVGILFTKPNADSFGRCIIDKIEQFAGSHENCRIYNSLGQRLYVNAIHHTDIVVGNSSSGIFEVASMKKPSINIGNRQNGRTAAPSVLHCALERDAIIATMKKGFSLNCESVVNPYGDGHSSERIYEILKNAPERDAVIRKKFYPLPE